MLGMFAQMVTVGAHAIGVATHATPAMQNRSLTEGYLTQPAVMADAVMGPFQVNLMVNLEGLTLDRGELNAGVWGEGYVDRRHPHTFLHEAVATYQAAVLGVDFSVSAGRGFASFGTDDPMVRPFVKYPVNHHLSQILERWLATGAVRYGPVIVEAGWFSGAEPVDPEDMGDVDKLRDSWSARGTLRPAAWLELQASYAQVHSPENPNGEAPDHEMWNASARVTRQLGAWLAYLLVETAESTEGAGVLAFHYPTVLAEAAATRGPWQAAIRFERTVRPEEERQVDLFRTVRPHTTSSILGTTRFTGAAFNVSRLMTLGPLAVRPFVEMARHHAESLDAFPVLPPEGLYGSADLWSFSAGIRSTVGSWHTRMGRYGAARVQTTHAH